jgi:hypothetical protein
MTLFIIVILLTAIVTTIGVLIIKVAFQISENIYFPIKQKPIKKNATKRIRKSPRKI